MDAAQSASLNTPSDCQDQAALQATVTALHARLAELEQQVVELTQANAELNSTLAEVAESEKRYRTLFELSHDGIYRFEFDPPIPTSLPIEAQLKHAYQHYRYAEGNDTFLAQYGLTHPEQLVGTRLTDFYPDNSEISLAANRAVIENGYHVRNVETEEIDACGQLRYFLQNIVSDVREGYVWGGWGTQTDITALKVAQAELIAERLQREQAAIERAAELERYNRQLAERDRILEATTAAVSELLTLDNFDEAVNSALQIIGERLNTDRVIVSEQVDDPSGESLGFVRMLYEWASPQTPSQLLHPKLKEVTWEGVEDWYPRISQGEAFGGIVDEFPEPFRSGQKEIGVKSTYSIPIMVDGKFWGLVGYDDCRKVTRRNEMELSVLKTAATCIGSAIERNRTRLAREAAERAVLIERESAAQERAVQLEQTNQVLQVREQWLDATANAANALLLEADLTIAINDALRILGKGVGVDRVTVLKYHNDALDNTVGFVKVSYEWDSPYASLQAAHPELSEISMQGLEDLNLRLLQGEWVGGLIHEFPEPFRSGQIALDVKSTYAVPIFVNETLWGILGVDHCREAKCLTLPEIAVFKTAANCISSAIQRVQMQQARENAERQVLEERTRLARDIHDTLAQAFTGVIIQLRAGQEVMATQPDALQAHLDRATDLARQGLAEARRSVQALRSEALVAGGLSSALQQTIQRMTTGTAVQASVQVEGISHLLPTDIESNLFRIGQEAITNALKHAQPETIQLNLVYEPEAVHLQIIDDGQGFEPQHPAGGFGLLGMRERADRIGGQFSLISRPGEGTTVTITVERGISITL